MKDSCQNDAEIVRQKIQHKQKTGDSRIKAPPVVKKMSKAIGGDGAAPIVTSPVRKEAES